MSGSFSVDVAQLGHIPQQLTAVRGSVAAIRVAQLASAAGPGAQRFAAALDAFAAAGAAALDRDAATLAAATAAYQRNDQRIVRSATTVQHLLGTGR